MLDFETNEDSGMIEAHATCKPFARYSIYEGAWTYLTLCYGDKAGPVEEKLGTFYSLEEAQTWANLHDIGEIIQPVDHS